MAEQHSAAVQLASSRRKDLPPGAGAPFYKWMWFGWKKLSRWIGNLLSRIVTTILFVIAVPLFALGVQLFTDPLELKPRQPKWVPVPPPPANELEEAKNGF